MTGPISPPPVTEWRPGFVPAYLSNGVIGLRVGHIPLLNGVAMLSSFEGTDPETKVEEFGRVPYPLAGDIRICNASLSEPGRAVLREQHYDFSRGELLTRLFFETGERRADIQIVTLCSRSQPSLALQEISFTPDGDCEVTISTIVDATNVPGNWGQDRPGALETDRDWPEGPFVWYSPGGIGKCGFGLTTQFIGAELLEVRHSNTEERVAKSHTFRAIRGQTYQLRQFASLVPQCMHTQPQMHAARLVATAAQLGFDTLRRENRQHWDTLWQGRVVLAGAPTRWQALADAAYFYLQTSVHVSSPSSTSVFGLAFWPNYHYYRGHMMWDLETFALPPLTLTNPDAALGLLRFRSSRLAAAQANAALAGYRGAQYPWESSAHGQEAAPPYSRGPSMQHHISMDVALAFARYVYATDDRNFAIYEAMPVLTAVAEWIESRVERTRRGFEIKRVIGIAETDVPVDNNAFINASAIAALHNTISLAKSLDLPYRQCWQEIADNLVIPMDSEARIILNHDGYDPSEHMGATPDAAAALFPLGFRVDPETEHNTLEFFVRLAHRYAGEPMLSAILGVYAARIGDRAASLELFEKGYGDFVVEPFSITTEFSPVAFPNRAPAGPFTANIGGFLTSCLYGLPGLHLTASDPAAWPSRKVVLPQGWDAIHVERIWTQGRGMTLHAAHGDRRATITE